MPSNKGLIGKKAEYLAADFLEKNGYRIIKRNYSTKFGEIDIIALKENYLCFIEVRSRTSIDFGLPEESLTSAKKRHLELAARDFIKAKNLKDPVCRFDMVCILFDKNQSPVSIKIENDII